jgi:hypothetical protein
LNVHDDAFDPFANDGNASRRNLIGAEKNNDITNPQESINIGQLFPNNSVQGDETQVGDNFQLLDSNSLTTRIPISNSNSLNEIAESRSENATTIESRTTNFRQLNPDCLYDLPCIFDDETNKLIKTLVSQKNKNDLQNMSNLIQNNRVAGVITSRSGYVGQNKLNVLKGIKGTEVRTINVKINAKCFSKEKPGIVLKLDVYENNFLAIPATAEFDEQNKITKVKIDLDNAYFEKQMDNGEFQNLEAKNIVLINRKIKLHNIKFEGLDGLTIDQNNLEACVNRRKLQVLLEKVKNNSLIKLQKESQRNINCVSRCVTQRESREVL